MDEFEVLEMICDCLTKNKTELKGISNIYLNGDRNFSELILTDEKGHEYIFMSTDVVIN